MIPDIQREEMTFDVVIIGGGPAGLAAAIRLKQRDAALSICLIDKASEIGAHIVSGAVIETRALDELFADWRERDTPISTRVTKERFLYLTKHRALAIPFPELFLPALHNEGNYIVPLGDLCRWMANQAEALGVEIFAGFAAVDPLIENDRVCGVITGDMGRQRSGKEGPNFAAGMILRARQTLLAEGVRGSTSEKIIRNFGLRQNADPQTYALGIKEVWEIPEENHQPGFVQHSFGWPLDRRTYGGSWLYHFGKNRVSYGFVVGLDYSNPWLSPFQEMQRVKKHPALAKQFEGGRRIAYGARALSEGGLQSLPRLTFPGGVLIGDCAGFLNVPKIKGTHTAMKSGMLAAEAVAHTLAQNEDEATLYPALFQKSWLHTELHTARNVRPAMARFGSQLGAVYSALDQALLRGKAPWTLHTRHHDFETLKRANDSKKLAYPPPDNTLTFDIPSSIFLSAIEHSDDQPVHLKLRDTTLWRPVNWDMYRAPESRYCPAGVYEVREAESPTPTLGINAQNCVHCKTCDIKDPSQNIEWTPPEGASGPNYPSGM